MKRLRALAGLATAALLALTACGSSSNPVGSDTSSAAGSASASASGGGSITVGSANFPESALLAEI
jgi:osmoprotectant transport system substrate-binding protein